MPKRFIDSELWKKEWFCDLSPALKSFWIYIFSNCDNAGVWEPNLKLAQYQIGEKISENEILSEFQENIVKLENGKYFIVDFIQFQYGKLKEDSIPHRNVFRLLEKHNIKYPLIPYQYSIDRVLETSNTLKDKDKDKDKDKEEEKDKDKEKDKIKDKSLWQQNTDEGFAEYIKISEPAFDLLLTDVNFIAIQKEYFPGCCVKRTLCRMWEEFWGTRAGWKNKRDAARGKPDYDIDWTSTIKRNFKKSICYYGKNEVDDELTQIAVTRLDNR